MVLHILHKLLDDQQAYQKADHTAHNENGDFRGGGGKAQLGSILHIAQQLQAAGTQHGGDSQEEGKFRCGGAGYADENGTENGGTGAGSTGNQAQALKRADNDGGAEVDLVAVFDFGGFALVALFHIDKGNAIDDQHGSHNPGVIQVSIQNVVKQETQYRREIGRAHV